MYILISLTKKVFIPNNYNSIDYSQKVLRQLEEDEIDFYDITDATEEFFQVGITR